MNFKKLKNLQLVSSKCTPVLFYGLEASPLTNSTISSLDFAVDRFFMKLFKTSDINIVIRCATMCFVKTCENIDNYHAVCSTIG